jgi:hypothetical protein
MPSLQTAPFSENTIVVEGAGRVPGQDPLDHLLSPFYERLFTSRSLQEAVAPLSKIRVTFSRFYHAQNIVVDWQPKDKTRHWAPEAKRRWCHGKGIVYVPIAIGELLSVEQFRRRLEAETTALATGNKPVEPVFVPVETVTPPPAVETLDTNSIPSETDIEALVTRPETCVGIQTIAEQRLSAGPMVKGKPREAKLKKLSKEVIEELTRALTERQIPATPEAVDAWVAARQTERT